MKTLLYLMASLALAAGGARADDIQISFDFAFQTGIPGEELIFTGTITNNGADTVFLNGDSLNPSGDSFVVTDQFYNTVPISLDAGQSSGDIELFDVTPNSHFTDTYGSFPGTYSLIGGVDGNAQDVLTLTDFTVDVAPEPPPSILFAAGLALILCWGAKRRGCLTAGEQPLGPTGH